MGKVIDVVKNASSIQLKVLVKCKCPVCDEATINFYVPAPTHSDTLINVVAEENWEFTTCHACNKTSVLRHGHIYELPEMEVDNG